MSLQRNKNGFTLIEVLIIVVVIGILAAIAIPIYSQYVKNAQRSACLSEVKSYSNNVFYLLNDQDDITIPAAPTINACHSMTDATDWTLNTQQKIFAIVKSPSNARIECDIPNGTPCIILP